MSRAAAQPKATAAPTAPDLSALPAKMRDQLWATKDLALYMGLSPRRVKAWWKKLRVPPDACAVNSLHRWTPAAVAKLLTKWRAEWAAQGLAAEEAVAKFSGAAKAAAEKRQLQLKLVFR